MTVAEIIKEIDRRLLLLDGEYPEVDEIDGEDYDFQLENERVGSAVDTLTDLKKWIAE